MSGDLLTFGFALVKKESQVDANETRGKAMAGKLTKQEKSWILYDVGNSAFVLLATALIPVYFKTLAEPGSSVVVAWGYAETVASLLLALLMPVLGSLADLPPLHGEAPENSEPEEAEDDDGQLEWK